jgi:phosphomannomutase
MVSISGIRGEVGSSLTPDVIQKYLLAFGTYLHGGNVVVGRDSRVSGPFIMDIVKGCLVASGCRVIEIGIASTPTVQLAVEFHKASGGIAITASHNPIQWNGLKFIDADGRFLNPEKAQAVYKMAEEGKISLKNWGELGVVDTDDAANMRHINKILNLSYINQEALKKRKFKVAIDTVNGAGGVIIPQLLEKLGCEVIAINQEANGKFAHTPEPLPENLKDLGTAVVKHNADLGFATDPDVDRCAIVDETGTPIGEEYTLAIAVKLIFSKKMGRMAINMSTSRASEDIARYYNCMCVRSKVGEINVVEKMKEIDAIIGGEGNGGVILPELHMGRDAPLAVALTLQHLLEFNGKLSELHKSMPQYTIVKNKVIIEGLNPDRVLTDMANIYENERIDLLDGVKIDFPEGWVHLRKSNTEPIVRVIAEAQTETAAKELADRFMTEIKSMLKMT